MPVSHRVRLAAFSCLALAAPATLGHARTPEEQMLMIEPSERIEQRCNARGMGEVGRAGKGLKPDELVAYAYADPVIRGARITAKGAAVRSGRTWYHLAYECETERDGSM